MNTLWIITVFDIIDELMKALAHQSHVLAQVPNAEILTVAVTSASFKITTSVPLQYSKPLATCLAR